jgi:hypothetical protein
LVRCTHSWRAASKAEPLLAAGTGVGVGAGVGTTTGVGAGLGNAAGAGAGAGAVATTGKQTCPIKLGTHCVLGLQSAELVQPPQRPPTQRPNGHCASRSVAQKKPNAGGMLGEAGAGAGIPPGAWGGAFGGAGYGCW